jgi:hypothetical protein
MNKLRQVMVVLLTIIASKAEAFGFNHTQDVYYDDFQQFNHQPYNGNPYGDRWQQAPNHVQQRNITQAFYGKPFYGNAHSQRYNNFAPLPWINNQRNCHDGRVNHNYYSPPQAFYNKPFNNHSQFFHNGQRFYKNHNPYHGARRGFYSAYPQIMPPYSTNNINIQLGF